MMDVVRSARGTLVREGLLTVGIGAGLYLLLSIARAAVVGGGLPRSLTSYLLPLTSWGLVLWIVAVAAIMAVRADRTEADRTRWILVAGPVAGVLESIIRNGPAIVYNGPLTMVVFAVPMLTGIGVIAVAAVVGRLIAVQLSTQFTTLRPSVENGVSGLGVNVYNLDLTSDWITSQAFGTYAAGDAAPLADLLAEVYGGGAPTLLGYGFFVDDTVDATIEAIEWDGQISAFTPVVSRSFPSSISITEASTTGIQISLVGALPTVDIYLELDDPNDDRVYEDKDTPIGPDGTFATTIVLPANAPLGTYSLTFDDDSYAYGFLGLMPDDQPIEVTAAILPATGAEDAGLIAVGLLVLLGGASLVLVSRRLGRNAA